MLLKLTSNSFTIAINCLPIESGLEILMTRLKFAFTEQTFAAISDKLGRAQVSFNLHSQLK